MIYLAAAPEVTDAHILRLLATDTGMPTGTRAALKAGAEALDNDLRLQATIAGLEATVAVQAARITELEDPTRHLVRAGDTLWSLARDYGTTVTQLREWNGLTGDTIIAGTTLRVR